MDELRWDRSDLNKVELEIKGKDKIGTDYSWINSDESLLKEGFLKEEVSKEEGLKEEPFLKGAKEPLIFFPQKELEVLEEEDKILIFSGLESMIPEKILRCFSQRE